MNGRGGDIKRAFFFYWVEKYYVKDDTSHIPQVIALCSSMLKINRESIDWCFEDIVS